MTTSRAVYTALLRLLLPILLLGSWWRAWRTGAHKQVFSPRRFGCYPHDEPPLGERAVWVHAVSLGETRAAQPLVQALLDQGRPVLLTHMTATGMAEGQRLFARTRAQGLLRQTWLPYDLPGSTQRFLAHYQPCVGVLMEREVWPNLLYAAQAAKIPMILASARLSEKSAQRTAKARSVMRPAYRSLRLVCAQTEDDAQRLRRAGALHVRVTGNFKFDVTPPAEQLAQGRAFAAALPVPVIAIASTREEENQMFVQALQQQRTRGILERQALADTARFLLIPRHPQRFDDVAAQLADADIPFVRWSHIRHQSNAAQQCRHALVVLGDTVGDMAQHYAAAAVAIIGGSFAPFGGQNLIEACAVGAPVIVGPHTWNFDQAAQDAITHGAAARATDANAALALALSWLTQPALRSAMAAAATHWVGQHTGAVARVLAALEEFCPPCSPSAVSSPASNSPNAC